MNEQTLLKNVLVLLAKANFSATGQDLMAIAEIIHQFNQYVQSRETVTAEANAPVLPIG